MPRPSCPQTETANCQAQSNADRSSRTAADSFDYFRQHTAICLDYAQKAKARGRKIVGIYCEFTPRELILAAGAVPICLCGGSHSTISAAEEDLPSNLCPLIKSSYGYIKQQSCPFFEMADAVVAETTCDGKKKMYELLADRKPLHILELPQKPDQEQAFRYWLWEVQKLQEFLEELCGQKISEAKLHESIAMMNKERQLRQDAYSYGACDPPYISGTEASLLCGRISGMEGQEEAYKKVLSDLQARRHKGRVVAEANAPRVLVTGTPMVRGAEKLLEIIAQAGGVVVAQENCTAIKPVVEPVAENSRPLEAIARKYFNLPCSCMTPNHRRLELLDNLIERYKPRAVIDLVWHACHTYNVESFLIRRHITGKHGLNYLKIETDYSPSDREQISMRVQALLELSRADGNPNM